MRASSDDRFRSFERLHAHERNGDASVAGGVDAETSALTR
jgi:hypothetical protein